MSARKAWKYKKSEKRRVYREIFSREPTTRTPMRIDYDSHLAKESQR